MNQITKGRLALKGSAKLCENPLPQLRARAFDKELKDVGLRESERVGFGHCTGQPRRRPVQFRDQGFHAVVVHGNRSGIEGIGLDEVRAGLQIGGVNLADDRRLGQRQQIVVALEIAGPVAEPFAPVVGFLQAVALDHGAHRAVQDQDAAGQEVGQFSGAINGHQRSSR